MNEIQLTNGDKVDLSVFSHGSLSDGDKAKVREYAKLEKAYETMMTQAKKLRDTMGVLDADWCGEWLWRSKAGDVFPIFDIEDDYLKNIVGFCQRNERRIPANVRKEYYLRFGYADLGQSENDKYASKKSRNRARWKEWDDEVEEKDF